MRYGENPHQSAAFYRDLKAVDGALANYVQLQDGTVVTTTSPMPTRPGNASSPSPRPPARPASSSSTPTCGVAVGVSALEAYEEGLQDRFDLGLRRHHRLQRRTGRSRRAGGRQAVRRSADRAVVLRRRARRVRGQAERCACSRFRWARASTVRLQSASAAACWCRAGRQNVQPAELRVVTKRHPTPKEMDDLMFAWRVAKFVKSMPSSSAAAAGRWA